MDKRTIDLLQTRMKRDVNVGIHGILDSEASRYYKEQGEEIRPPFFRDVDRIVHSKVFARYIDKVTEVRVKSFLLKHPRPRCFALLRKASGAAEWFDVAHHPELVEGLA